MGCPIGSVIMGSDADIEHARVIRKMLGGQMRQVGILASCGLISLKDWEKKLTIDHENAKWIAKELKNIPNIIVHDEEFIETNILRYSVNEQ